MGSERRLQEEAEAPGHHVLFYPKLHYESAKWFAGENRGFGFEILKATVPKVLASVSSASIRGSYRLALLLMPILQACNMEWTNMGRIAR